jgi:hypothetical protein
MNVTVESLKKIHGDNAPAKFREIASLGGFGHVPDHYEGGLDITSVLSDENDTVSKAHKRKIQEILTPPEESEKSESQSPAGENVSVKKQKGGSK